MRNLNKDLISRNYSEQAVCGVEIVEPEQDGMCVFVSEVAKSLRSEKTKFIA